MVLNPNTQSSSELLSGVSLYAISVSLLPRLLTLALLFVFCRPRLDQHTYSWPLELIEKFQATIETDSKITTATMYVVKGKHEHLLCYDTSVELNIVPIII
jgi:hypothetical protein